MAVDHGDAAGEFQEIKRRLKGLETGNSGGDSMHPGTGADSVQIGPDAAASGDYSVAIGDFPIASGYESVAVGASATASEDGAAAFGAYANAEHEHSAAVGRSASTTASYQVMLGTASHTVVVPGTFSNPSARHLKRDIIPAPNLRDIFPELTEWEYIDGDGKRRIGYIADELVGTDAERFLTFDDDGRPSGIDYLGLLVVQVAQLRAEIAALKNNSDGGTHG